MRFAVVLFALGLVAVIGAWVWPRRTQEARVGGLYSVAQPGGYYLIAKVLVVEPTVVHVRLYKQRFAVRPRVVEPAALSLGRMGDPDGVGLGHMPLSRREFLSWQPVFVRQVGVTEDELDGYHIWQQSKGGVWGKP